MDFSTIAFCSESKRRISLQTFLSSGTLIHQSSTMGIHQSEGMPFVELTGHKLEEPIVSSPFQFDLAKSLGFANKLHTLAANNTKNSMKDDNLFSRKDMYNNQLPAIAISQLVGGFVGSKSQVGSSSRESCQIWDIIFDKLAEFCEGTRSDYTIFADKYSQSCYNLGDSISQEFLGSLCKSSASTMGTSKHTIENSGNKLPQEISESFPCSHTTQTVSCEHISQSIKPANLGSPSSGLVSCPPDLSKQSYADVARTFAVAQQNKQQSTKTSAMQKARNSGYREEKHKRRPGTSGYKNNWRYPRNPSVYDWRNSKKVEFNNKTFCNRNNKCTTNLGKEGKTERNKSHTDNNSSDSDIQRIDTRNVQNMKFNSVQNVSKEPSIQISCKKTSNHCSQGVGSSLVFNSSNNTMKYNSSVEPCISIKCNRSEDEVDDCAVYTCKVEVGSMPLLIHAAENVKVSPKDSEINLSEESTQRCRFSSECSTDSDDSFVIFESNVECDAVIVALMRPSVSESEISEDGIDFESSSDEECDDDDDDDDDTETITGLNEVNEKWQRDYSKYPACEKSPTKVKFANDSSLKTIRPMVTWNHAYRTARRGPWEQMARDRERFTTRIKQMEPVLAPVLSTNHRLHIWKGRFADDSINLRSQVT